jgi:membrane-bound serine protease (ClpP class)
MTLKTAGAPTYEDSPTIFENILYHIADPNIAFLLLTLGGLALLIEVFHPTLVGGIVGVISLVFAYFALGSFEANYAGVALVLFGIALLGAELFIVSHGVLGIGGIISLALGGLLLTSGSDATSHVSRGLIVAVIAIAVVWVFLFAAALYRLRRTSRDRPTRSSMVGKHGLARTRLEPKGMVTVEGERWEATTDAEETIEAQTPVVVIAVSGLQLKVRPEVPMPETQGQGPTSVSPA